MLMLLKCMNKRHNFPPHHQVHPNIHLLHPQVTHLPLLPHLPLSPINSIRIVKVTEAECPLSLMMKM